VTPCTDLEGPTVLLNDGTFRRIESITDWRKNKPNVLTIWDSGEILIGYGEFLENNKNLVPSPYNRDWWSVDLAERLDMPQKVEDFASLLDFDRSELPLGLPFNGAIKRSGEDPVERVWRKRNWSHYLRDLELSWAQIKEISITHGTAIPPPWNLWWSDLPISFCSSLIDNISKSIIEENSLRFIGAASEWSSDLDLEDIGLPDPTTSEWPLWTQVKNHGIVKSSLMTLGISHHHDGEDIVIESGWEGLLEGFGFNIVNGSARVRVEAAPHIEYRLQQIRGATNIIEQEELRLKELESRRDVERIAATTTARQVGKSISETEQIGDAAAAKITDEGPDDDAALLQSRKILDDHEVDRCLWLVRKLSTLRWEDAVPVRIGARMGRPEKAARREMKPLTHALYPIGENGGPQRLMGKAAEKGRIRVELCRRYCSKCGQESPNLNCHHRPDPEIPKECGGKTAERERKPGAMIRRRRGRNSWVHLDRLLEVKRRTLGLDRLPQKIKSVKVLTSESQTPEPIEKGILRGKHQLSVFRDGTA
ncbi:MAG TPA: hypothetical protein EYQ73_08030, partial [Candidatus Poseidoniales archaeon]|nr:hypothetical protein [Candidatus Poseidoniales archaeon]